MARGRDRSTKDSGGNQQVDYIDLTVGDEGDDEGDGNGWPGDTTHDADACRGENTKADREWYDDFCYADGARRIMNISQLGGSSASGGADAILDVASWAGAEDH